MVGNQCMKFSGEYEIFSIQESDSSLRYSDNEIKVREFAKTHGYGVRVVHNRRIGFSYGEEAVKIPEIIKEAEQVARFSVESSFTFQGETQYPSLAISDKKLEDLTAEGLKELLYQIRGGVEKYTKHARIYISGGSSTVQIENSAGLEAHYNKTGISAYVEATEGDGFGYSVYSSHFLPKDVTHLGEEAGKMALEMQHPQKVGTGKYTVVFEPEALNDMLEVLLPSFSGDWKRRGISGIADKKGMRMFDEKLSIYDDATAPASHARPCDDEGSASKRIPLIENGVVKNFIYDRATAALSDVKESGACNRNDFTSLPVIGNSNVVIEGGTYSSFEDELRPYILVKSLHGTHTANTTTGDFGVEVNIAWQVKDDKRTPVRGFILSGNLFTLLGTIYAIEKGQITYGNLITPRIACENVQVVG